MPHIGRFQESGVYNDAVAFVREVHLRHTPDLKNAMDVMRKIQFNVIGKGSETIVLETVKRGEDDEARGERSVILRLFESMGGRTRGKVQM